MDLLALIPCSNCVQEQMLVYMRQYDQVLRVQELKFRGPYLKSISHHYLINICAPRYQTDRQPLFKPDKIKAPPLVGSCIINN